MIENQENSKAHHGKFTDFLYKDESYKIRGAIFEVYRELGCGFLEGVYQTCLEKEFVFQKIPFRSKPQLEIFYKGEKTNLVFIPDFICYDRIIIELKAVSELIDDHRAQLHNYLRASGQRLGFLVNFGHCPRVDIERFAL